MAHAEGWIEAYAKLEEGRPLPDDLKATVLGNRNRMEETMLHWYAIEGVQEVVEKLIDLGFDLVTRNRLGRTPLFECIQIDRWDIVELLLRRGADTSSKDENNGDVFENLESAGEHARAERLKDLVERVS